MTTKLERYADRARSKLLDEGNKNEGRQLNPGNFREAKRAQLAVERQRKGERNPARETRQAVTDATAALHASQGVEAIHSAKGVRESFRELKAAQLQAERAKNRGDSPYVSATKYNGR